MTCLRADTHRQTGCRTCLRAACLPSTQADAQASGDYPSAWLRTDSEQLTFLLFLKVADEQSRVPFNKRSPIPKHADWQSLLKRDGDELETHYRHVLESLGKQKGMLGSPLVKLENASKGSKMRFLTSMRWRLSNRAV